MGAKWIRQHRRLCLSSWRRNLWLKGNKKVSYLNKKSLRVFEFRDSYVLSLWTLYVHFAHVINCEYGTHTLSFKQDATQYQSKVEFNTCLSLFLSLCLTLSLSLCVSLSPLSFLSLCPVGWGCRINRLHLCRGVRLPQWVSWYDTKQSDCEVPVMLELWGMWSTHSLLSLPGPLWTWVVAPDKPLSRR